MECCIGTTTRRIPGTITPNVIALVKYIGPYDLFAQVIFEDFREYFKKVNDINGIKSIDHIDIFLVPMITAWPPNVFAYLL